MDDQYIAKNERYDNMVYRRCGKSGIQLPAVSLGLWHNFGFVDNFSIGRQIIRDAFDMGITHFDLANNYGPPPGSAEEVFSKILNLDLKGYRDELIISSKAGYLMWPGPYGEFGSRKYIIASCDQSLKRMGLEYVDIFYSHRPDPDTPVEETMSALDQLVRSGKALYAGISNYNPEQTQRAVNVLKELGTPCLVHQPKYSMFHREPEDGLLDILKLEGVGTIVFSPLAQGLLTNKYIKGIPENSRAAKSTSPFLTESQITPVIVSKIKLLNEIAVSRNQSLAQMAIAWLLKDERVTSVLVGASSSEQLADNTGALKNITFSNSELKQIETILNES
ncbi:MAG: L-glyceraldehyde 3-phosphate reductase [Bacteroidales bacterium]|nr:L-glyceraldehyde 3-phosphate reductase [Bacteroidales bacterium]